MKDKTKERWMCEKCLSTVVIDVEEDIKEIIESRKKKER